MNNRILPDTYLSFDIESSGFIPGKHAMLSLGVVAYRDYEEIDHFYGTITPFKDAKWSKGTKEWWQKRPVQIAEIKATWEPPAVVMKRFYDWCLTLEGPLTLAANPACFDTGLLFWYLDTFVGEDAITELFKRHRALDIRSYIMAVFGVQYSKSERYLMPKAWSEGLSITHNALDDAREQGVSLMHLMKSCLGE